MDCEISSERDKRVGVLLAFGSRGIACEIVSGLFLNGSLYGIEKHTYYESANDHLPFCPQ